MKPNIHSLVCSGSYGCHLLGAEPEDESASVGACGSVQFSAASQHEEAHLNRHVVTHHSLSRPPTMTSLSRTLCVHTDPSSGQLHLTSPCFLTYLFDTSFICTHTHTGRGCIVKESADEKHICYCWGDRLVFMSTAFICTCPPRLFILSSSHGEESHQLMFSFTVIG